MKRFDSLLNNSERADGYVAVLFLKQAELDAIKDLIDNEVSTGSADDQLTRTCLDMQGRI